VSSENRRYASVALAYVAFKVSQLSKKASQRATALDASGKDLGKLPKQTKQNSQN
jgi:hypothetical protein